MTRTVIAVILMLGLASVCQAQTVHSVCVMPVDDSAVVQVMVERWLQSKGIATVDCISHPGEGDAVLGFFANRMPVETHEYYFYHYGRSDLRILKAVYPASGITIWLQSHRVGDQAGSLFIGKMLFYGCAADLPDGLKKVLKAIRKENQNEK